MLRIAQRVAALSTRVFVCCPFREKFVEYFDLRDAQKALDDLSGMNFNGATLNICFAQNASRTV